MLFTNLETERLLLDNINSSDRDFIFSQFSDDVVTKYLYDEEPFTDISEADNLIDFYITPEPRQWHRWVIRRKTDNANIGTCGFHCWDTKNNRVDVGYDMKKEFWGNGYMTEAMNKIIEFARLNMNIKEIVARIYIDNEKSIKLAQRLGFKVSGSYNETFRGKEYPHSIYSLYL